METSNGSVFEFDLQDNQSVPPGQYLTVFKDIQKTHHQEYGDGVMFIFEIAQGDFKGVTLGRIGKPQPTRSNITGKIIAGILGSYTPGQKVNLQRFVGKPYTAVVESAGNNRTQLAHVFAYQPQQSFPAATEAFPPVHDDPFA